MAIKREKIMFKCGHYYNKSYDDYSYRDKEHIKAQKEKCIIELCSKCKEDTAQ